MKIKKVCFENIHSISHGSCIFANESSLNAFIEHCQFYNCSSSVIGSSSLRYYHVCGGSIYLNINNPVLRDCIFVRCTGSELGSVVYTSVKETSKPIIDCICDISCGNSNEDYHSVYAFEGGKPSVKNVNSTNPVSISRYGVVHIGSYPLSFIFDYITVVFTKEYINSVCFGVALNSIDYKGYLTHVFLQNSTNTNGIFALWQGQYYFNDLVLYECSGTLYRKIEENLVTIQNSRIWVGIDMFQAIVEQCISISNEIKIDLRICGIQQTICIQWMI